jgi:hypothetical protein
MRNALKYLGWFAANIGLIMQLVEKLQELFEKDDEPKKKLTNGN